MAHIASLAHVAPRSRARATTCGFPLLRKRSEPRASGNGRARSSMSSWWARLTTKGSTGDEDFSGRVVSGPPYSAASPVRTIRGTGTLREWTLPGGQQPLRPDTPRPSRRTQARRPNRPSSPPPCLLAALRRLRALELTTIAGQPRTSIKQRSLEKPPSTAYTRPRSSSSSNAQRSSGGLRGRSSAEAKGSSK